METTSPKLPELTPEQIWRAADYVELVWHDEDTEEARARLEEFHRDGKELARLMGEFGALLLADHLTVVPDEHADCGAGYVMDKLAAVASRYLKRWCYSGGGAQVAYIAAGFLIECMQEVDQVSQFLCDVRGSAPRWNPAPCRGRRTSPPPGAVLFGRDVARSEPGQGTMHSPGPRRWTSDACTLHRDVVHSRGDAGHSHRDVAHRMRCIVRTSDAVAGIGCGPLRTMSSTPGPVVARAVRSAHHRRGGAEAQWRGGARIGSTRCARRRHRGAGSARTSSAAHLMACATRSRRQAIPP